MIEQTLALIGWDILGKTHVIISRQTWPDGTGGRGSWSPETIVKHSYKQREEMCNGRLMKVVIHASASWGNASKHACPVRVVPMSRNATAMPDILPAAKRMTLLKNVSS